jgi:hypothetical protein
VASPLDENVSGSAGELNLELGLINALDFTIAFNGDARIIDRHSLVCALPRSLRQRQTSADDMRPTP